MIGCSFSRIRLFLFLLVGFVCSNTRAQSTPSGWTPEEMINVRSVRSVQVSPDGRRVVFTVAEPVMSGEKSEFLTHIYMAKTDGSGSLQFTFGEKSCTNPQWSPDGQWIAFTSNRSGRNEIWLIRADGGDADQLTDVSTGVVTFRWSPDGKWIAFTMPDPPSEAEEQAKREKRYVEIADSAFKLNRLWIVPFAKDARGKREPRLLTPGEFNIGSTWVEGFDWSPDSRTIAFSHTPTPKANDWTLADISTVDVGKGEIRPLVHTGAAEIAPLYSPDGRWIAYRASDNPPTWGFDFTIWVVATAGGQPRKLGDPFDRQPTLLGWSGDGKWVYYTEARGTVGRVSAVPVDGGPPKDIDPGDRVLYDVSLNHSRTAVGVIMESSDRPPEAYITKLDKWDPIQVSHANADIPKHALGRTEVIHWKAKDGLEIEGLLTYPVGYQPGRRYPLLLLIHGGPTSIYGQTFLAHFGPRPYPHVGMPGYPAATFAMQGYALLRCNPRGSSGYGKRFRYANYKDWGGGDFQDLMAGVDYVVQIGVADPERLGVMGWSYGGYMTSWVITQTRRFKAASVGAGVPNLMSFTGTTEIPSFIPDYLGAEFWDNLDVYRAHSAMFNIKGVSTPTLIQHGERDPRVPLSQPHELYNALKRQGVPVRMIIYPRQPHAIQEPRLLLEAARHNLEWFNTYVAKGHAQE